MGQPDAPAATTWRVVGRNLAVLAGVFAAIPLLLALISAIEGVGSDLEVEASGIPGFAHGVLAMGVVSVSFLFPINLPAAALYLALIHHGARGPNARAVAVALSPLAVLVPVLFAWSLDDKLWSLVLTAVLAVPYGFLVQLPDERITTT